MLRGWIPALLSAPSGLTGALLGLVPVCAGHSPLGGAAHHHHHKVRGFVMGLFDTGVLSCSTLSSESPE